MLVFRGDMGCSSSLGLFGGRLGLVWLVIVRIRIRWIRWMGLLIVVVLWVNFTNVTHLNNLTKLHQ